MSVCFRPIADIHLYLSMLSAEVIIIKNYYTNMPPKNIDRTSLQGVSIESLSDGRWKASPKKHLKRQLDGLIALAVFLIIMHMFDDLINQYTSLPLEHIYTAVITLIALTIPIVCIQLLNQNNNFYIIDSVQGIIFYHFQLFYFEREFRITKFDKIACVTVLSKYVGYRKSNRIRAGGHAWNYHIAVVLKNKKIIRLTLTMPLMHELNEAAEALAQIMNVKCWKCKDEHSSKIECDAATSDIIVTYQPYDGSFLLKLLLSLGVFILFMIFVLFQNDIFEFISKW